MKCERCGKGIGLTRRGQAIADGYICYKCLDEIGFDKKRGPARWSLTYDEIIKGPEPVEALIERKAAEYDRAVEADNNFKFAHYGDSRELDATDDELELYETVCAILEDEGFDLDDICLVRKSDSYLTIALGETDVARIKFTDRVKWILFPYTRNEKIRIGSTSSANKYASEIVKAYEAAAGINSKV